MPGSWVNLPSGLALQNTVEFGMGSLTEEEDYEFEVSRDPTFATGVTRATFRTLAQQHNVDLAGVSYRGEAVDLSDYDLSIDRVLIDTRSVVLGTSTISATAADSNATVAISPAEGHIIECPGQYQYEITVTNQTSQRVYTFVFNIVSVTRRGDFDTISVHLTHLAGCALHGGAMYVAGRRVGNFSPIRSAIEEFDGQSGIHSRRITENPQAPSWGHLFDRGGVLYGARVGDSQGGLPTIDTTDGTITRTPPLNVFYSSSYEGLWGDTDRLWRIVRTARQPIGSGSDPVISALMWGTSTADSSVTVPTLTDDASYGGLWGHAADGKLYAANRTHRLIERYTQATGARDDDADIPLVAENISPRDLTGDDFTIWVADDMANKLFAYDRHTGEHLGAG